MNHDFNRPSRVWIRRRVLYECTVFYVLILSVDLVFQFCEEFKEKCPYCVPCGLRLSDKSQPAVVRHFGLQILEHVIK